MNYKCPVLLVILAVFLYYYFSTPSTLSGEQLTEHLNNKVVLICGASSGIGEELAYQLAPHGTKLVLVARSQDKLDKVRLEVIKRGAAEENVLVISFDFSNVAETKKVVDKTVEKFGGIDYLVSNHAAIVQGPFLAFPHSQKPEFLERMFRVNVFSHIELAVQALPHLEKSKGHMFITSSMAGEVSFYSSGVYVSTKHAINGFFYSLQQELLAKESPVSLTIGALGLIWTKEMAQVFNSTNRVAPGWATGDLEECSRGMMEAYITRPLTFTYPRLAGRVIRGLWYTLPCYHDMTIQGMKVEGAKGTGYREMVEARNAQDEISKKMNYQQGYKVGE
ncbi:hypothetical protein ACHWQZ_G019286 [Mnemiopsis leidyi]